MSGELSNPRELEALQTSIDSMKSLRTELEDKSVERLVLADSLQGKLKEKQEALAELETTVG